MKFVSGKQSLQTDSKKSTLKCRGMEGDIPWAVLGPVAVSVCVQTLPGYWYSHQGLSLFLFKNCYIFTPGSAELLL